MKHPINPLTEAGLDELQHQLTNFVVAYDGLWHDEQRGEAPVMERCLRILPTDLYNELNAYLCSMKGHISNVSELLYGQPYLLALDGFVPDELAQAAAARPSRIVITEDASLDEHTEADQADPHGISFNRCLTHDSTDEGCSVVGCAWYRTVTA